MENATPSFDTLGLRPELLEALSAQGFTTPTEVQAQAIPAVLTGRDMMVQSRTGSGKTLAFALPTLQRLESREGGPKILAVAPTRELATQVAAVYTRFARTMGMRVATLTGGMPYGDQLRALNRGAQIIVGTPGRLNDHLDRGSLDLSGCETVVLDEADEILDMGFQEDLEKLLGALPKERQTLLFSATLSDEIEKIGRSYMQSPQRLGLSKGMEASATLTHAFYEVGKGSKYEALVNLLHTEQPHLAILFCHTKAETEDLTRRLTEEGFKVGYLNGNLPQSTRTATLDAFKHHQITLLVATDVAARGIDVRGISHVINYDIPRGVETYIHRSGRTARAGQTGTALNLVTPFDRAKVRGLIRDANLQADWRPAPQAVDVRAKLRDRFFEELRVRIDADESTDLREFAESLVACFEPTALVAALLQDVQAASARLSGGYEVEVPTPQRERPMREPSAKKPRTHAEREPRERLNRAEGGMSRLRINIGKADRIVPGYLVRKICDAGKIKGEAIGAILLHTRYSLVDIRADLAPQVLAALNGFVDDRGRKWNVIYA